MSNERENRYAEAIWPSENGKFRNPHLRELEDEQVLRVMAVADEERAAALREAAAEFASRTQEAAGQVREHWRGQDFVDGQDTAYESAAEWLEARADDREAKP